MVFAADKVSKARELRRNPGAVRHVGRRLGYYRHCLSLLRERLPGSPLVNELDAELVRIAEPVLANAR